MCKEVSSVLQKFFTGIIFFAVAVSGRATDIAWTNTVGGLWTTATNWSPNQVPTNTDLVWITNAGTLP